MWSQVLRGKEKGFEPSLGKDHREEKTRKRVYIL
jgi:hypothetical protein